MARKGQLELKAANLPSEAEAAEFWDSHSPLDYPAEYQAAAVKFSRPLVKRGLTVKLSDETLERLRTVAQECGLGPSTLARMWIMERLQAEQPRRAAIE